MHPDIVALNAKDPPPRGCKHPAYEVDGRPGKYRVSYLDGGTWNQPVKTFETEAIALRWILDRLYYDS